MPGLTCKATASRLRSFIQNLILSSPGSIVGAARWAGALSASFRLNEVPSSKALFSRRAGRCVDRCSACRICTACDEGEQSGVAQQIVSEEDALEAAQGKLGGLVYEPPLLHGEA